MVYNIASASTRFSTWLTENNPFSRAGDAVSKTEGKWIGRSLLVPVLAGVLCASIVDSVAVGGQGRAALTQIVKDPAAMFEGRSPGERGAGAMYNTKHKAVATPSERTLANVPVEPAGLPVVGDAADPVATALFAQPDTPPADSVAPEGSAPMPAWFTPPPVFSPIGRVDPIGGGEPSNPGGSENPGTTPVNPVDPNTPPPAVPEPATWLTLIVGLFSVGAALRYQRRVNASALGAEPAL